MIKAIAIIGGEIAIAITVVYAGTFGYAANAADYSVEA